MKGGRSRKDDEDYTVRRRRLLVPLCVVLVNSSSSTYYCRASAAVPTTDIAGCVTAELLRYLPITKPHLKEREEESRKATTTTRNL